MNILVVGNGGREHALAWKIKQSPQLGNLYVAPGNAGTEHIAENIDIKPTDIQNLLNFAREKNVGLTVVGPEAPLALGIVDAFEAAGFIVFGASKKAAELESSKAFSKMLMQKYGIPCAKSETFVKYETATKYLEKQTIPIVIKVDGLAAGKGVVVARTMEDAREALDAFMKKKLLGDAGNKIIIEEYLTGKEVSVFAFSDGQTVLPAIAACDHKTVWDNNLGPNTGGMGSFSPPFFWTQDLADEISKTIMKPVVKAMVEEGRTYKGILYGGLILTAEGPKVLEFNARFGDPETQSIMPLLKSDLVDIMLAIHENNLKQVNIEWQKSACVGVVMASQGYPGSYKTGFPISGFIEIDPEIIVFHSGTKEENGQVLTNGGRVLTVAAVAPTIELARKKVYENIELIRFEGCHYRKDIGLPGR